MLYRVGKLQQPTETDEDANGNDMDDVEDDDDNEMDDVYAEIY